jgi:hypothetical protein
LQSENVHETKNWKERLHDYIKINKKGEHQVQVDARSEQDVLQALVATGKLKKAVKLIESSESDDIKQNQQLQAWLVDAQNAITFNQAIRNIAAYCLAEMKVNNLKNKD